MANQSDGARNVATERFPIEQNRYDLSIFQTGEQYYASWFCEYCPKRGRSADQPAQETAYADGVAILRSHHATCHSLKT